MTRRTDDPADRDYPPLESPEEQWFIHRLVEAGWKREDAVKALMEDFYDAEIEDGM